MARTTTATGPAKKDNARKNDFAARVFRRVEVVTQVRDVMFAFSQSSRTEQNDEVDDVTGAGHS